MSKCTVLICDDNIAVHSSLTNYLNAEGMKVVSVFDGETALDQLSQQAVDMIVLDIMLPGMDGFDICKEIRRRSAVPIIMLSARSEEYDRIIGLELGADDYVVKPFSPREVVIRIKKLLKRHHPDQGQEKLTLAELTVFPDSYRAFIGEKEISMTAKEIELLSFMMANAGKVLTREYILNTAWGYDYYGDTRVIDSLIKRLRQKLMKDDVHFTIRSVYGVGYTMEEKDEKIDS